MVVSSRPRLNGLHLHDVFREFWFHVQVYSRGYSCSLLNSCLFLFFDFSQDKICWQGSCRRWYISTQFNSILWDVLAPVGLSVLLTVMFLPTFTTEEGILSKVTSQCNVKMITPKVCSYSIYVRSWLILRAHGASITTTFVSRLEFFSQASAGP